MGGHAQKVQGHQPDRTSTGSMTDQDMLNAAIGSSRKTHISYEYSSGKIKKADTEFVLLNPVAELHKKTLEDNGYVFVSGKDPVGRAVHSGYIKQDKVDSFYKYYPAAKDEEKATYAKAPQKAPDQAPDKAPRYAKEALGHISLANWFSKHHKPVKAHPQKDADPCPPQVADKHPKTDKKPKDDGHRKAGGNQPVKGDSDTWGVKSMSIDDLLSRGSSIETVKISDDNGKVIRTFEIEGNPNNRRVPADMDYDPYVIRSQSDSRYVGEADLRARKSGEYHIMTVVGHPNTHFYLTDDQFAQPSVQKALKRGDMLDITKS